MKDVKYRLHHTESVALPPHWWCESTCVKIQQDIKQLTFCFRNSSNLYLILPPPWLVSVRVSWVSPTIKQTFVPNDVMVLNSSTKEEWVIETGGDFSCKRPCVLQSSQCPGFVAKADRRDYVLWVGTSSWLFHHLKPFVFCYKNNPHFCFG